MKKIDLKKYGRVMVFIDVANVIYSLRDLRWKIDYKKLQRYFQKYSKLVSIYFYFAYRKESVGQKNLLEMLSRKGFKLRTKEVKFIKVDRNTVIMKGNCDVELTIDMIALLRKYDTAVLMSGDSDFAALVKFVQKKGKKVIVISTRGHISKELIESADRFMYFNKFRRNWEMRA